MKIFGRTIGKLKQPPTLSDCVVTSVHQEVPPYVVGTATVRIYPASNGHVVHMETYDDTRGHNALMRVAVGDSPTLAETLTSMFVEAKVTR